VVGYSATLRPQRPTQFAIVTPVDEKNISEEQVTAAATGDAPLQPPTRGLFPGLAHGWTPILLSGFAFGLAHIGHGVAPVALFLFGMVLGYLYQRTHRLVPSITAHLVFNAHSMLVLWLTLPPTSPPVARVLSVLKGFFC